MSRAALPIGTWGRIHARAEKRDDKGEPVSYDRTAPNPAATDAIQQAFEDPDLL
jgi:hypothetical protein